VGATLFALGYRIFMGWVAARRDDAASPALRADVPTSQAPMEQAPIAD
jgi:hypothetical protein